MQVRGFVQLEVFEVNRIAAVIFFSGRGSIRIHECRSGAEVGGADVQRLVNVADVMDEEPKRGLGWNAGGVVGGVAVAFEDGDAIPDHVDDVDVRSADGVVPVMRLLNRDVGVVIGILVMGPGGGRQVRIRVHEGDHVGVVRVEVVFAVVRPGRGLFQGLIGKEGSDVREGVRRIGDQEVGDGADGFMSFVAVAEGGKR